MNIERRSNLHTLAEPLQVSEQVHYQQPASDEIYLGDLIRSLYREWKVLAVVMAFGIIGAIVVASYLSRTYLIEAMLRVPTVDELGELAEQNIIEISPQLAMKGVVEQLVAADAVKGSLENSNWWKEKADKDGLSAALVATGILKNLSVVVARHDYYELEKNEKAPFQNIKISLPSSEPEAAAEFVQTLIKNAHERAVTNFSSDVIHLKNAQVSRIKEQLNSLSLAAKQSREARIKRLQESNQLAIATLQLQIDSNLRKARQDRENRIIRLQEALKTAAQLGINEPVTWDDLRPLRKSTQVINELGNGDNTLPDYFRGTRLLQAEFTQLKEREDDKPFVGDLTEFEKQIIKIQNDPALAALKARVDDSIYVEQYDDLQRKMTDLLEQPTEFSNAQMVVVTQPAQVPSKSIRNPVLIFIIGIFLSGFFALIVGMICISVRNSKFRQAD